FTRRDRIWRAVRASASIMSRFASLAILTSLVATSTAIANPRQSRSRHQDRSFERVQAIANACNDAMTGRANEQQCMTIVNRGRGRFAPAPTIQACERAMTGDANALACLSSAVNAHRDPVGLIGACEQAMT